MRGLARYLAVSLFLLTASELAADCKWEPDSLAWITEGVVSPAGTIAAVEARDGRAKLHVLRGLDDERPATLCDFPSDEPVSRMRFSPNGGLLVVQLGEDSSPDATTILVETKSLRWYEPSLDGRKLRSSAFVDSGRIVAVPIQEEDLFEPLGFALATEANVTPILTGYVADSVLDVRDDRLLLRAFKPAGNLLLACLIVASVKGELLAETCEKVASSK